jgi:hypothetical protein
MLNYNGDDDMLESGIEEQMTFLCYVIKTRNKQGSTLRNQ